MHASSFVSLQQGFTFIAYPCLEHTGMLAERSLTIRPAEIPTASHYNSEYLGCDAVRLTSYRIQLASTMEVAPVNALVIGKGDGMVPDLLKAAGVLTQTLDIQADLAPDICASVLSIPFSDSSFDVTLCCQVLEHLPYASFGRAMKEMARVTRKRVLLSLPDQRRYFSLRVGLGRHEWLADFSVPRRAKQIPDWRRSTMGHQWEIGFSPVGITDVLKCIRGAGLSCTTWRNPDFAWHCFFACDVTLH